MGLRGLAGPAPASDCSCSYHVAASVPALPLAKAVHRASSSTLGHCNAHRFHHHHLHRSAASNMGRRSRPAPPMAQPSTSQGASALRTVDGYEDTVLNSADLVVQAASSLPHHGAHAPSMDDPDFISDGSGSSSSTVNSSSNSSEAQVHELREQLEELRSLVTTQQEVIRSQQVLVEELKRRTVAPPPQPPPQPQPPKPAPLDWSSMPASPFEAQRVGFIDRRHLGMFDARYHSTNSGATPKDFRVLPDKIILVRHAESEGNVDNAAYTYIPDPQVPLTARGHQQARQTGQKIKKVIDTMGKPNAKLFFYTSPYKRSLQTYEGISSAFTSDQIRGVQEEVQLREQDFGNFQDAEGKQREKADRLRFGRFFYRFPNGESGADVYDRITIFEDHMIRDINAGRFGRDTSLVLVSHGLALRVFLMRWFHWTVDQFLNVYNPPNCEPLVLERVTTDEENRPQGQYSWVHTKALYRLASDSMHVLKGCSEDMCVTSHESKSRISKTRQLG